MINKHALRRVLALSITAVVAAACSGSDHGPGNGGSTKPDNGDFETAWVKADDPTQMELAQVIHDSEVFEDVTSALNDMLKLPRQLPVTHASCGEENAFYDPSTGGIVMCYELLQSVALVAYQQSSTEEELGNRLVGTWMFVFFHELGHALIDLYDLPITGKEEDAVDDFSAVLLVEAGLSDLAIAAAEYWFLTDSGMYTQLSYADEHSLNAQRAYSILCTVYGSDPQTYAALVSEGYLPETRAVRCPGEYEQKSKSWGQLLEPWAK